MNRNPPIMRLRLHWLWYDLATLLLPSLRRLCIYRCASSSRVNVIYATRLSQPFPRNEERERGREGGLRGCRRETNYFPQQHASMLFTAHNELFELRRENTKCPTLYPYPPLFTASIFFPALRRNAPEYFRPANFLPIANDLGVAYPCDEWPTFYLSIYPPFLSFYQ